MQRAFHYEVTQLKGLWNLRNSLEYPGSTVLSHLAHLAGNATPFGRAWLGQRTAFAEHR